MSKYILDTRLSEDHYVICSEAIRRGIIEPDDLNEGRRTMGEQWAFYRNQPPLAAFPSRNAPHIWLLRNYHAIDSNSFNGAARRLANFYRSLGIQVVFNVPGEDWHFQPTSAIQLKRAADKIRRQRADERVLAKGEKDKKVKFFKHQLHYIRNAGHKAYYRDGQPMPEKAGEWFNDDLHRAVRKFQEDHELKADGKIGPKTDAKIDKVYATQKRRRKSAKLRAQERAAKVARGEEL